MLLLGELVLSFVYQDIELINESTLYKSVNEHGFLAQVRVDQQNRDYFVELELTEGYLHLASTSTTILHMC